MQILIQPESANPAAYEALGLGYELLEASAPGKLDMPLAACWRGKEICVVHGAFIDVNPASNDSTIRAASRRRCRLSCEIAKDLGARAVIFHSGFFPYIPGDAYADGWAESSAAFYEELIAAFDLDIQVENCLDRSPDMLLRLMTRRRSARLRVCLDVGHIHYGPTPDRVWFHALGPYIAQLHFSDNLGEFDDHLPLGAGSCDWGALSVLCAGLPALPEYITLEVGGPKDIVRSLDFLKSHRYFPFGGEALA